MNKDTLKCLDCGMLYLEFPLDVIILDEQWIMIHPEGLNGILCANCIIKRASKLKNVTAIQACFDINS